MLGVPDERWGEAVKACVVLEPNHAAAAGGLEAQLIDYCKQRLPRHKAPKSIEFFDALQVTTHGGLSRTWLRGLYVPPRR